MQRRREGRLVCVGEGGEASRLGGAVGEDVHARVELEGCGDAVPCPCCEVAAPGQGVEELEGFAEDCSPRDRDVSCVFQWGREVLVLGELD